MVVSNCTKEWQGLKIKWAIYGIFLAIIVICFIVSNNVLLLYWGKCERVNFSDFSQKSILYSCLDDIEYRGGSSEALFLYGWAFAETDEDNTDKQFQVLLVSDEACYELSTETYDRPDVTSAFEDTYRVLGNRHGFDVNVSTLSLPSGEYELYVYCYENELVQGVSHLGKKIVKNGRNMTIENSEIGTMRYPPVRHKLIELQETMVDAIAYADVVSLSEDGASVQVIGWAFCETEQDNSGKEINLLLRSESGEELQFYASLYERQDVYDAFQDSMKVIGTNHGFSCSIPVSEIPAGIWQLYVVCRETETELGIADLYKQVVVSDQGVELIE